MGSDLLLIDTGPLVALLNGRDAEHLRCVEIADAQPSPMLTTWVVMAEATWLLRDQYMGLERLLATVENGVVTCFNLGHDAAAWMAEFARQYQDLHPQLVDLSLAYLAEREGTSHIFTLDRRDFLVLKSRTGKPFDLVP